MPEPWTAHPAWTAQRARWAAARRHHPDADTADLERDLLAAKAEAKAETYARALAETWSVLTETQRARLAPLLPGGDTA
jgi:hypothetical protein